MNYTKPGLKSPIRALVEVPKGIRPPSHNQLRAPARAIEPLLDAEEPWIPTVEPHAKSPEEEVLAKIFSFIRQLSLSDMFLGLDLQMDAKKNDMCS